MGSAYFLCLAGWSLLALGMDRHHLDAFGTEASARRLAWLQRAGWLVLLLSLALALWARQWDAALQTASLRATAWVVVCSLAAVSVVACLSAIPRHTPGLAPVALALGVLLAL